MRESPTTISFAWALSTRRSWSAASERTTCSSSRVRREIVSSMSVMRVRSRARAASSSASGSGFGGGTTALRCYGLAAFAIAGCEERLDSPHLGMCEGPRAKQEHLQPGLFSGPRTNERQIGETHHLDQVVRLVARSDAWPVSPVLRIPDRHADLLHATAPARDGAPMLSAQDHCGAPLSRELPYRCRSRPRARSTPRATGERSTPFVGRVR